MVDPGQNTLSTFQLLQLIQMARLREGCGPGGGVTGTFEIRTRDILAILLIAARLMGWQLADPATLAERIRRELVSGAAS